MLKKESILPKINVLDKEGRWSDNEDEPLWWPRVLWIDPGVVSGVAVVWFDPRALFARQPTQKIVLAYSEMFLHGPENGTVGQISEYLALREYLDMEKGLATGCESFIVRQANQSQEFLSPVRIRAALDYQMSMIKTDVGIGIPLFTQSPADAINSFSNERLRIMRMYTPGPDHVNDAKRHCLLWIRSLIDNRKLFERAHGNERGWFE